MTDQLEIPGITPAQRREAKLEVAFREFHAANPRVYATLRRLALAKVRSGATRLGAKALYEVMRWELDVPSTDPAPRFNNNHVSRYARLLMRSEPQLRDVFETRTLTSEDP